MHDYDAYNSFVSNPIHIALDAENRFVVRILLEASCFIDDIVFDQTYTHASFHNFAQRMRKGGFDFIYQSSRLEVLRQFLRVCGDKRGRER